jgi:hypothetical protein
MLCNSRYTDETYAQQFGDGRHKFYLEFRCNRPCLKGLDSCLKCAGKSPSTILQYSRKFDHGKINEPIPDTSHIFGGKWYNDGVKKWGAPPSEITEFALQYQKEARGDFIVIQPDYDELYKAKLQSNNQEMPRSKKEDINHTELNINALDDNSNLKPVKRSKKPKIATETETDTVSSDKPKRTRKPKIAPSDSNVGVTSSDKSSRVSKKNTVTSAYASLINNTSQLIHKEVVIPTHIETNLDKLDTDGYDIEFIKLSVFETNGNTYLIDKNKNKLYKKIKEKGVGAYIGRWNPDTDTIINDIPDSDEEI